MLYSSTMSFIDSRTVFLLTSMMGGLMALILLSIKRSYQPLMP